MSEPTACGVARCHHDSSYCARSDLLVGLDGLHVLTVNHAEDAGLLRVGVESAPGPMGCGVCGGIAHSHGRRDLTLVDAPCFGRPVRLTWRKRTWRCAEPSCPTKVFTEHDKASPRRGADDDAGVLVGDQPDPSRARQHQRDRPPTRYELETRCGPRSGHCWRRWPTTSPGPPA